MYVYLSSHTTACMTRQGLDAMVRDMIKASTPSVTFRRIRGNLIEGKLIAEFEAETREGLAEWLKAQKIHFDWLIRVDFEAGQHEAT